MDKEREMLLHIRPRFYSYFKNVSLIDLEIEPFGLRLIGGEDLATRRPYPNKWYAVACRKTGSAAIDGILIECPKFIDEFKWKARWAVEAEFAVVHHVTCRVIDQEFDAVSDDAVLWYGTMSGWSDRRPVKDDIPLVIQPVMELDPDRVDTRRSATDYVEDGQIVSRYQQMHMPTIEPGRILERSWPERRAPKLEMAFRLG
jgi:hypothetical protein